MISILALTALAGPPRAALSTSAVMPKTMLKPGDPIVIQLTMINRTDQVLYFEEHSTGACFLQKYADIEASPPIERKPVSDECKPTNATVKPGEKHSFPVDIRDAYVVPERDYAYFNVIWKDGGPDIYSPLTERVGPVKFREPFYEGRMEKGGDFYLPNKTTAVWNGHQSKPPARKGDPPTLVIDFLVRIPGTGESPRLVNMRTDKSRQFKIEGYVFEMSNHQFDQWMDVRIFEP